TRKKTAPLRIGRPDSRISIVGASVFTENERVKVARLPARSTSAIWTAFAPSFHANGAVKLAGEDAPPGETLAAAPFTVALARSPSDVPEKDMTGSPSLLPSAGIVVRSCGGDVSNTN